MGKIRIVRGKRRRRRSERAQFRDTLQSAAKQFGLSTARTQSAWNLFVKAMTEEARKNGRPL